MSPPQPNDSSSGCGATTELLFAARFWRLLSISLGSFAGRLCRGPTAIGRCGAHGGEGTVWIRLTQISAQIPNEALQWMWCDHAGSTNASFRTFQDTQRRILNRE